MEVVVGSLEDLLISVVIEVEFTTERVNGRRTGSFAVKGEDRLVNIILHVGFDTLSDFHITIESQLGVLGIVKPPIGIDGRNPFHVSIEGQSDTVGGNRIDFGKIAFKDQLEFSGAAECIIPLGSDFADITQHAAIEVQTCITQIDGSVVEGHSRTNIDLQMVVLRLLALLQCGDRKNTFDSGININIKSDLILFQEHHS